MSYGYLLATRQPSRHLTEHRQFPFQKMQVTGSFHVYFRDAGKYCNPWDGSWLHMLHQEIGDFVFCHVLLRHKEGEAERITSLLKQLDQDGTIKRLSIDRPTPVDVDVPYRFGK
ncbi:MAG: hypothetical protein ACN6N0_07840 [Microvirgula sp.]